MAEQPRYKKIVVPIDGSGWSQRAIPHAVDIARSNNAKVVLLHVLKNPISEYTDQLTLAGQETQVDQLREQLRQHLAGLVSELRNEKIDAEAQLIEGAGVANIIADFCRNENVDLIVMSTHGRTGIAQFFFGSVAHKLMHSVKIPVLLIHPDRE